MKSFDLKVDETVNDQRIFDFVFANCKSVFPSKSSVKRAFKTRRIHLNNNPASSGDWIVHGDTIKIKRNLLVPFKVYNLDLDIVYEDNFIAIINKPAGIAVSGNFHKNIQNSLTNNLNISPELDSLDIPRPVHRLDKMTAGLLIIAKTRRAQKYLGSQLEMQKLKKKYIAIVKGSLISSGEIVSPINGLNSITIFKTIQKVKSASYQSMSLVELYPVTGRTHQLRIHLSQLGHPIIGDYTYDFHKVLKGKGLFLFASMITFKHPITQNSLSFQIPIPNKFNLLIDREKKRWKKFY